MPELPPPHSAKNDLRKQALTRRASLPIEEISGALCQHIAAWACFRQAEEILFYFPFRQEVDLRPLYHQASEKIWYLPAVLPSHDMVFRQLTPDFELKDDQYGIPEPSETAKVWQHGSAKTLLLIPGVLFDPHGYRLGYGKGYYDRFLSLPQVKDAGIPKVGIVPHALLHPGLPHDAWDIPMNFLATEQGMQSTGA